MKKRKLLFTILCGMLSFGACAGLTSCSGKEKENSEEPLLTVENKEEEENAELKLQDFTDLEVITDSARFTPATQDQSYNPATDMNPGLCHHSWTSAEIAETDDTVYMNLNEGGGLYAFHKDTLSADIACGKPDCEHDVETVGGECQANLRVLDAAIGTLQCYNGELYYSLGGGSASILYKISPDREKKEKCISLVGEKGYGSGKWVMHREYIYFSVSDDGIYRAPVDNMLLLEKIVNLSDGVSSGDLQAYGSYVYFTLDSDGAFAMARYNIETNQIEQLMGIPEFYGEYEVHNEKIYFSAHSQETNDMAVHQYDIATAKSETLIKEKSEKEGRNISTAIIDADLDYFYIRKNEYSTTEMITEENTKIISYQAYTWDGTFAGEVMNIEETYSVINDTKPFDVIHEQEIQMAGSDSDRIYYMGREYDEKVQENGVRKDIVEGTEKTVIYYINKSELSPDTPAQVYTAGEIYD